MIGGVIYDGYCTGAKARVDAEGQLNVIVHPHPPVGDQYAARPFRQLFKTSAGASDMRVNGSTTNVEFLIESSSTYDTYIKSISIALVDASATLNKFGNLTALTTGLSLVWETADLGTVTIADSLKTNFDLIRLAAGNPSFGDGAAAFRANNVSSTSEGYLPVIDCAAIFGLQYGLKLRKEKQDKVIWTVKDDLSTGIDQFDIIAYGIQI
jgi:hypothetical protein